MRGGIFQMVLVVTGVAVAVKALNWMLSGSIESFSANNPLLMFAVAATISSYICDDLNSCTKKDWFYKSEFIIGSFIVFFVLAFYVFKDLIEYANYKQIFMVGGFTGFVVRNILFRNEE